jgi:hypothetical protein
MERTMQYTTIIVKQLTSEGTTVQYPLLVGLKNREVQTYLNEEIKKLVHELMQEQMTEGLELQEMTGKFDIKVNKNYIVSLVFTNYAYWKGAAHGLTLQKSITMNVDDGTIYELKDLFKSNSYYKTKLTTIIKKQIKNLDIPIINPFKSVKDSDDFYLTDQALIMYYPIYEYTPYYVNIPEFTIPYTEISDLISLTGPIPHLLIRK